MHNAPEASFLCFSEDGAKFMERVERETEGAGEEQGL